MLSRFATMRILWYKIIRVTLQVRGVQETLKCGLGKKEVQNQVQGQRLQSNFTRRIVVRLVCFCSGKLYSEGAVSRWSHARINRRSGSLQ